MSTKASLRRMLALCLLLLTAAAAQEVTPQILEQRLELAAGKNRERQARLAALLEEAGCEREQLVQQRVRRSRLPNVICTLPGRSDEVIVVGAHYDKTRRGQGVADNWSGAALLPTLLEGLAAQPRHHTFIFVGFTDEEVGLRGSRGYVGALSEQQKANIRAMVNLDTLGLGPPNLWSERADPALAEALRQTALSLGIALGDTHMPRGASTDSESFRAAGIPTVAISSLTEENWPILHTARDNREALDLAQYEATYRLVAAYLASLDVEMPQPAAVIAAGVAQDAAQDDTPDDE